jgi:uncharacterized membrane protein
LLKKFEGFDLKPLKWFGTIVIFTVLTLIVTYLIPGNSLLAFLRYFFSFIFVAFLPGYCLVSTLFLGKNKLDIIEALVLSVALSLGLAGLVGLFLGLSPIGINFTSITVSLSTLVLVLAAVAFLRKRAEASRLNVQTPQQISA